MNKLNILVKYECNKCRRIVDEYDIIGIHKTSVRDIGYNVEYLCKRCFNEIDG